MAVSVQHKSALHSIGNKVRQGMEIAGTLKGIYDTGSAVYKGATFAAPIIAGLMLYIYSFHRIFSDPWEHPFDKHAQSCGRQLTTSRETQVADITKRGEGFKS